MKITNDLVRSRLDKLSELTSRGIAPYAYSYDVTRGSREILADPAAFADRGEVVRIAGRLVAKRPMGKAGFGHVLDRDGRIQVYFKRDDLGTEAFDLWKLLDVGDWIGVEGTVFQTRTGEWTVSARRLELLSKALLPLPEKWHGLRDKETRYRQRYTDLVMNEEVRAVFRLRARLVSAVRRFLDARDFLEVETPALQPIYGGASARPFTTVHNALDMPLYLRISDELYLKRLIVGGLDRVYEISKDFRNEGIDRSHNPEFTMLEFYQAYADYEDVMRLVEAMCVEVVRELGLDLRCTYQGRQIDLSPPYRRLPFFEALAAAAGREVRDLSVAELRALLVARHIEPPASDRPESYWDELFDELVQPGLVEPTFIIDYPREVSPLARVKRGDERLVERFEFFAGGLELGNAFSEQIDPEEQERQLERQDSLRQEGDVEAQAIDEDYIRALMIAMPPTGGFGLGIDRLTMLLADVPSIRDVILFPLLRPVGGGGPGSEAPAVDDEGHDAEAAGAAPAEQADGERGAT